MNFHLPQIIKKTTVKGNLHVSLYLLETEGRQHRKLPAAQLVLSLFNLIYSVHIYGALLAYMGLLTIHPLEKTMLFVLSLSIATSFSKHKVLDLNVS